MRKCFCNISALELYRASGRLAPDILHKPRTAKLNDCSVPPRPMLEDDLKRYGIKTHPCHVLCETKTGHAPRFVARHTHRHPLPARSLIVLNKDTLVVTPELLFLELAASREIDDIELLRIGFELCGTYVLDVSEDSWDGYTGTDAPITSAKKISAFIERCSGMNGSKRARRLARLIADGSHSPMETVAALLVSLPHCMGGWNLGRVKMNQRIMTADGPKWVDIFFYKERVGLEYKGRRAHSIERTARDDRRQNRLTGTGITVLNIWYEDLAQEHLCEKLMHNIAHSLGKRIRLRSATYEARRRVLYATLMPSIQRYEQLGG